MYFGNVCHSALPPLALPVLGRTPPPLDIKPLLPFHLLPAFTDMDHVHKALMCPGFALTSPLKRKSSGCRVCRQRFNSEAQASSHYSGTKHAKRLKALDGPDTKTSTSEPLAKDTASPTLSSPGTQPSCSDTTLGEPSALNPNSLGVGPAETVKAPPSEPSLSPGPETLDRDAQRDRDREAEVSLEGETEEEKAVRLLYCSLCKVAVNSASQLQAHNSGTKHKTMLEARSGHGAIKSFPRAGVKAKLAAPPDLSTGLQNKTFHCEICDVHVNSETQLKQHISSRRHKDRAAGKPAKPKFSPYPPVPRHHSLQIHLALQKNPELTKPLASCLLQRQLSIAAAAAVAAMSASNSAPGPALFRSRPHPLTVAGAMLHPSVATPICSTQHTSATPNTTPPLLFSPY